ncbi:hypothetical protein COLO4_15489 [Corchorus olitorius]|uniref:Uncharacterized protein n=1 Tax=Corchorus olitorius TaxID=93759 RepID=A0A1R3JN35_9ROSI|nr:hypothetical protein COLO4_15489 [Corchorus olitorius]
MDTKPRRRAVIENGDTVTGEDLVLDTLIGNGDDVGPLVRHAFEMGRPEPLVHQLKHVVKKEEGEIEELCKTHYEDFMMSFATSWLMLKSSKVILPVIISDFKRLGVLSW